MSGQHWVCFMFDSPPASADHAPPWGPCTTPGLRDACAALMLLSTLPLRHSPLPGPMVGASGPICSPRPHTWHLHCRAPRSHSSWDSPCLQQTTPRGERARDVDTGESDELPYIACQGRARGHSTTRLPTITRPQECQPPASGACGPPTIGSLIKWSSCCLRN